MEQILFWGSGAEIICFIKGAVSRYFSLIKPIWAPDKQAKMVFLKIRFREDISNLQFEKFDSAQANTAQSQIFLTI